jgi:decaprenyl-phosphate phosphoribosyltransferase
MLRRDKPRALGRGLLTLARPDQWPKNLLVLAAPAAAGVIDHADVLGRTLLLLVAFTLASVAVYALNDVRDVELDRLHLRKRRRPVASGAVSVPVALCVSTVAAIGSLVLASRLGPTTTLTVGAYLAVSGLYSLGLKHIAVLDVISVSSGFVLRSLSGAAANQLPVSNWFLLTSLFGALYLVAGKRTAEASGAVGSRGDEVTTRPALAAYPIAWLQQLVTVSLAGTVMSYAMWAFQYLGTDVFRPILAASFVPFLIVLLRYGLLLAQGKGERPERLLLGDGVLATAGGVWVVMAAGSLYLA